MAPFIRAVSVDLGMRTGMRPEDIPMADPTIVCQAAGA